MKIDSRDMITIKRRAVPEHLKNKQIYNPEYPYKQVVACPKCGKILSGSASRGKMGAYYPRIIVVAMGIISAYPSPNLTRRSRILCGLLL